MYFNVWRCASARYTVLSCVCILSVGPSQLEVAPKCRFAQTNVIQYPQGLYFWCHNMIPKVLLKFERGWQGRVAPTTAPNAACSSYLAGRASLKTMKSVIFDEMLVAFRKTCRAIANILLTILSRLRLRLRLAKLRSFSTDPPHAADAGSVFFEFKKRTLNKYFLKKM